MTEADDIRDAVEAGEEVKRSLVEAVRLADEERAKLTGQVQDDRRDDAPPERALTTDQVRDDRREDEGPERKRTTAQIRQDRQSDLHFTTDQIQKDRREDEAPRTALELVRADKLTASLVLLESVRKMCLALLVVMVVLGMGMVFMFDYMGDNREKIDSLEGQIEANNDATLRVEKAFTEFSDNNTAFLDNHSRTQRLICGWYRAQGMALPDNGDCENR